MGSLSLALSSPLQKAQNCSGSIHRLSGGWQLRERGLAGSALAVYFLGSQAWSSGMNLVCILRKFIFDSGRAGEEVNDRKRREGSEILWGCPHNTTSSPITKAARR